MRCSRVSKSVKRKKYFKNRIFFILVTFLFFSNLLITVIDLPSEHPRVITAMKSLPNENLGVAIVGQLNFGIFVKEVQPNSCVFGHDGLRCGDQILEVRFIYCL